jgi:hypothetical protein
METAFDQTTSPKASLYQKLWAVMQDCDYVRKDKRNSFHNYTYASEQAIKEKVHAALVKHRLLFLPSVTGLRERSGLGKECRDGQPGKETLTIVKVRFRFVDIDSGAEEKGQFYATGADSMDKGLYKAITGALKYILTSWLLIPTGDDPEIDREKDERQPARSAAVTAGPPPAPKKPWQNRGEMKVCFARIREQVGDVAYFEELGKSGIESPVQFRSAPAALACYQRLCTLRKQQEAVA